MNAVSLTIAVFVLLGFTGALSFVLLYSLHPMTRKTWWRSPMGRNLLAYSAVMMLLYGQGIVNLWFPNFPWKDEARVFLGLSALIVIWWRLGLLVIEISAWRKRRNNVHQEILAGRDRADGQDDGTEPDRSLGDR